MSRRPTRRDGGHTAGSSSLHRNIGVDSSFSHNTREGATLANRDELERVLEEVIVAGGTDGVHQTLNITTPPGSLASSSASINEKGLYKGLALEKGNKARGGRLEVEITSQTGRPSMREQATALAYEMGLACRECLPLFGDWCNIHVDLKQMAFERMNARLKLINLEDLITYNFHLRHMGLIRRRWRERVHQEYMLHGEEARPAHTTNDDWQAWPSGAERTAFWQSH